MKRTTRKRPYAVLSDPAGRMIWVSLPRATFGIVIRDGRVVDGAPYARGRGLRLIGMDEKAAAENLRHSHTGPPSIGENPRRRPSTFST